MHDVDRPAALVEQALDCVIQTIDNIFKFKRNRALRIINQRDLASGAFLPRTTEERGVTKCRRHRDKLRFRELQQGNLPC